MATTTRRSQVAKVRTKTGREKRDEKGVRAPNHRKEPAKQVRQLTEFLLALGYEPDETVHGYALPPRGAGNAAGRPRAFKTSINALRQKPSEMKSLQALNEGLGLYIRPNAGGATDAEIDRYHACFAEFDDRPIEEQVEAFNGAALQPTVLVETRKSVHGYYRLEGHCTEEQWREIQRGLIAYLNSDPSIKNPSRLMRSPSFDHLSIEGGKVRRKPVEIILLEPSRRYTASQMLEAFPIGGREQGRARVLGEDEPVCEFQRNTTLTSLAGTMRRRGMSADEILPALLAINERRCKPPLEEDEVMAIAAGMSRYAPDTSFPLTDLGNAERLVARHGQDLLYCNDSGKWLIWDGKRYCKDMTGGHIRRAKDTVRSIYEEAAAEPDDARRGAIAKWAKLSESERSIKAMIALAASESSIAVTSEDLDSHQWLLNVTNGTIDLRTGELREHRRQDLLTKLAGTAYDPAAESPEWQRLLETVMAGDMELVDFLQDAFGYSLTGSIREQLMFVCSGIGSNGKSTLLDTFRATLGDYAMSTPTETLMTGFQGVKGLNSWPSAGCPTGTRQAR